MSKAIEGLAYKEVWEYFEELSAIPRESGNESGMREYVINFADTHNLVWETDAVGNVVIRKPASPGNEQIAPTVIQGHMDMVCVKSEDSDHDFTRDPITLVRKGDWMYADNTTLGADNGIAIAMALALFADSDAVHGPLEALFTTSEETGLDGALGLDGSIVHSRRLINLDTEEEGEFIIGCAGGCEIIGTLEADFQPLPEGYSSWTISLSGFLGGHSGGEIHTGRGNAILYGMRFLRELAAGKDIPELMISAIGGGSKRNVIPSTFSCTFSMKSENKGSVEQALKNLREALSAELSVRDPKAEAELSAANNPDKAVSPEQSAAVINAVLLTPNGPDAWSTDIEGLVETSNNMAVLHLKDGVFTLDSSQRSSVTSARDAIAERSIAAFETSGADVKKVNTYPAWTPNITSPFAKVCADSYRKLTGNEPVVTAIHAGLECGVINSRVPGMDSISFGPDILRAHSVEERVEIGSTGRIYSFLKQLLADLC